MATSVRWASALAVTQAGVVLVPAALEYGPGPATRIVVRDPARAMALAASVLHPTHDGGAYVATTARCGHGTVPRNDSHIGEYAVLGAGVTFLFFWLFG